MEIEKLIRKYLGQQHMMQVATMNGDQPWCCTVYYVFDKNLRLYWASLPGRRHSQEIHKHPKVAAAIPIRHTNGEIVVGIQVEGNAQLVSSPADIGPIALLYAKKFNRSEQWAKDFTAGTTQHKLYCLTPRLFVLFDEHSFTGGDPRREWNLEV